MEYIKQPKQLYEREPLFIQGKMWFYPSYDAYGGVVALLLGCQEIDEAVDEQLIPTRYNVYVIADPDCDSPAAVEDFCATVGRSLMEKYNIRRWLYEGYLRSKEDTRIIFCFTMGGKR